MKTFLFAAVFLFAMFNQAQASVDCNVNKFNSLTQEYICLSPEMKEKNNYLRREESKLSEAEKMLREKIQEMQQAANNAKTEEQAKLFREKSDEATENLNFYQKVREKVRGIENGMAKCRNDDCLLQGYQKVEDIFSKYKNVKRCEILQIPDNCKIYVYSENSSARKSQDIFLSNDYYTFESKLKINIPNQCVYLFLSSQYASVWDIMTTANTDLQKIFVSGNDYQMLRGYPQKTVVNIGLNKDLAKNPNLCFNGFMDKEKVLEFFTRHKIDVERINFVSDGKIGDNAPIGEYKYVKENASGYRKLEGLRPREQGWEQLMKDGKARKLNLQDFEYMKANGIVNLDNEKFYIKTSDYKFIYQYSGQGDSGYVLTGEVDYLPSASEHEKLFLAPGAKPPFDIKLNQTFSGSERKPDMFSKSFMMLPVKNVPQFVDCNYPNNLKEKIVCADDTLRGKNEAVKKIAVQAKKDKNSNIVDAYQAYRIYGLQGCENRQCLDKFYDETIKWFENKEYSGEYEEKEPAKCQLKPIADDCEVYAYSSSGGEKAEKSLFISTERITYSADVKINRPGKCVVLFLSSSSYNPVIWNIYYTPQTNVQAILVGGHYEQMIRGMSGTVETKNRHGNYRYGEEDQCLNYQYDKDDIGDAIKELHLGLKKINILDRPVIGEEADASAYHYNPEIVDGEFLALDIYPEEVGLEQLQKAGKIRKLTKADAEKIKVAGYSFIDGASPEGYRNPFNFGSRSVYVMLGEIDKLPNGLTGGNRIILLIPEGLKVPDDNSGHSDLYRIKFKIEDL